MQQHQSLPQRNSNLRELPIALGSNDPVRPPPPKPISKIPQTARPGQGVGGGATRGGRSLGKTALPQSALEMKNEIPAAQTSTSGQKTSSTPAQVTTAKHTCTDKHNRTHLHR